MKKLLSLALAVLVSLTPMLTSVGIGTEPASAQTGQRGVLSVPIVTTNGDPATLTVNRFFARDGKLFALSTVRGFVPAVTDDGKPAGRIVVTTVELPVIDRNTEPAPTGASAAQVTQQATCPILNLVLGPLHVDLLGLVIDLNQVVLTIVAESGAGNLLGNLLCAIAGLLDPPSLLDQLVAALNRLLDILGSL